MRIVLTLLALVVLLTLGANALAWYAVSGNVGLRSQRRLLGLTTSWPLCIVPPRPEPMGNEAAAISALRDIHSAQGQFKARVRVDEDHDRVGEFGTFGELGGDRRCRGTDKPLDPPALPITLRGVDDAGQMVCTGYAFRIWLPGKGGSFVAEPSGGFADGDLHADAAEHRWRCYAWPLRNDSTGIRTFFIDENREIWSTDDPRYSGDTAPVADAAIAQPNSLVPSTLSSPPSYTGADGCVWTRVE